MSATTTRIAILDARIREFSALAKSFSRQGNTEEARKVTDQVLRLYWELHGLRHQAA